MGQHEVDSVTLLSCASHSDDVCSSGRQVELMLGCNGLVARDSTCSSQAPMCVLYQKQFGQWAEFARTEPVLELVNPKVRAGFKIGCGGGGGGGGPGQDIFRDEV